jgi:acetamidase/formamidase
METLMHSHNQIVPGTTIDEIKKLRTDNPGRGPHSVTGPIFVEGASPGDVLSVTINRSRASTAWSRTPARRRAFRRVPPPKRPPSS